jgi:hypothetical protein
MLKHLAILWLLSKPLITCALQTHSHKYYKTIGRSNIDKHNCLLPKSFARVSVIYASTNDDETDPSLLYRPGKRAVPQGEFAYTETNVRKSAETFKRIRDIGGKECTNDIYVRNPSSFEYFYVGKVARTDGTVTLNQAVSRLWNLIEEHATRLRPVELGREFGRVEVWTAPGDTEFEMSQAFATSTGGSDNVEKMNLTKMDKFSDGYEKVKRLEVGFMAEVVTNMGKGFCIVRDDEGKVMQ